MQTLSHSHSAPAGMSMPRFLFITITDHRSALGELLPLDINQEVGRVAYGCVFSTVKLNLLGYMCQVITCTIYTDMYIDTAIYIYVYILLFLINGESHIRADFCSPHSFSYNIHLNFRT